MFKHLLQLSARFPALRFAGLALLCTALLWLDRAPRAPAPEPARSLWPATLKAAPQAAWVMQQQGGIPMPADTPAAHASSLLAMPSTHPAALLAFWFAGSRESAADVQIAAAQFERATQQWSAARFVVNREDIAEQLGYGVRRLGNPVAWRDAQGRPHLFVVGTGWGGWAAARIVHLRQSQPTQDFAALRFEVQRVLPLSWWWNISSLVRTAPLPLVDGGMVLPAYFELGVKYPLALRFDAAGEFLGLVRISRRTHVLQPTLLMRGEAHWLALMRDQRPDGKVGVAQTLDGGQTWIDLPDLPLHNPDASVAALGLAPDLMFLAHNPLPKTRTRLDLSASSDAQNWLKLATPAQGSALDEYSYPALAWADDSLWLSYTDQRRSIAWQRFSLVAPTR